MEFYASCPEGFESALADELKRLGLSHVRRLKGRATFEGELEEGYRACLWSRLASRVFVVLGRFEAQDADELYDGVYDIAWESIVRPGATIAITARGVTEQLRNTRFSALRAKDALCDRLAETTGRRADVDAADPDVHLLLSLRQRRASISLDLSGDPLFKRLPPAATRAGEGAHVLRPDYAALVLAQVGWTALCERELTADDYENDALPTLVDASCAGGGLLLELGQVLPLNLGQALFPGQDVHGQLLLILGVQLKHLVQVGHVLHQGDLVGLQVFHNLIHVGGGFGVPGFQGGQLILFPAEKAGKAFFLLLRVKFLQLPDQVGQGLSDLPQVLGADLLQGVFGKLGDILLGGGAVLEDHVAVGDVNGPGKVLHSFPLGWGELGLVQVALRQMRL